MGPSPLDITRLKRSFHELTSTAGLAQLACCEATCQPRSEAVANARQMRGVANIVPCKAPAPPTPRRSKWIALPCDSGAVRQNAKKALANLPEAVLPQTYARQHLAFGSRKQFRKKPRPQGLIASVFERRVIILISTTRHAWPRCGVALLKWEDE